jgi:hypothetical protein
MYIYICKYPCIYTYVFMYTFRGRTWPISTAHRGGRSARSASDYRGTSPIINYRGTSPTRIPGYLAHKTTGVPRPYETAPTNDPTAGLCIGPCGDPREVGRFHVSQLPQKGQDLAHLDSSSRKAERSMSRSSLEDRIWSNKATSRAVSSARAGGACKRIFAVCSVYM